MQHEQDGQAIGAHEHNGQVESHAMGSAPAAKLQGADPTTAASAPAKAPRSICTIWGLQLSHQAMTPFYLISFFMAIGLLMAIVDVIKEPTAKNSVQIAAGALGFLLLFLIAKFIAWVAFRVHNNSQKTGNGVFALLCTAFLIYTILTAVSGARRGLDSATAAQLNAQARTVQEAIASDSPDQAVVEMKRMAEQLRSASDKSGAMDQKVMRAFARNVEKAASAQTAYQSVVEESHRSLIEMHLRGTAESCDNYIQAVNAARRANAAFLTFLNERIAAIPTELVAAGMSQAEVNEMLTARGISKSHQASLRSVEIDDEALRLEIARAELLRAAIGQWHWDDASGTMIISDDDTLARYSSILAQQQLASQEQESVNRIIAGLPPLDPNAKKQAKTDSSAAEQVRIAASNPSSQAANATTPQARAELAATVCDAAMARMTECLARFDAASERLGKYQSFYGFTRQGQFKAYTSVLEQYIAALVALRDETATLSTTVEQALLNAGFSQAEAAKYVDEYVVPDLAPMSLALRDAQISHAQHVAREAEHLSARIGQWTLHKQSGTARFVDAKQQAEYQKLIKAQQAAERSTDRAFQNYKSTYLAWAATQQQAQHAAEQGNTDHDPEEAVLPF